MRSLGTATRDWPPLTTIREKSMQQSKNKKRPEKGFPGVSVVKNSQAMQELQET